MGYFVDMLASQGASTIGGAANGLLGLALAGINDKRQLRQQERLNRQQEEMAKRMGDYNYAQQMKMWKETGYAAQKEQMKEAGLNPALMYGMSGGGGQTVGSANASAGGVNAPAGGGEAMGLMGMSMQMQLMKAQKENIEADTNVKNTQAAATAGVETDLKNKQIESLSQGIGESRSKQALIEVQSELAEIDKNFKNETYKANVMGLKYNTDIALQQLNILRNDAVISEQTWSTKIDMVTSEAAGILLRNRLTEAQTEAQRAGITKIVADIQAQIKQLSQKDRELSQQDEHIIIDKARNELIELGIWVGAGSQVLGDAVNLLKKPTQVIHNHKKDIIIREPKK